MSRVKYLCNVKLHIYRWTLGNVQFFLNKNVEANWQDTVGDLAVISMGKMYCNGNMLFFFMNILRAPASYFQQTVIQATNKNYLPEASTLAKPKY